MICTECSTELPEGARFCNSCGAATGVPQSRPEPQPTPASEPKRFLSRGLLVALMLYALVILGGAGGIAFAVSQTAEGPRGEQGRMGEQGPKGERGPKGSTGAQGGASGISAFDASRCHDALLEFDVVILTAVAEGGSLALTRAGETVANKISQYC